MQGRDNINILEVTLLSFVAFSPSYAKLMWILSSVVYLCLFCNIHFFIAVV